jgi:ABC-type transporter Mla maintaining outer membrane lipid asymmetry ATPase subunit MlaF
VDALVLEIENLQFRYGKTIILDHLFFNVSPGTIVGIVGASGSG